MPGPRGVAGRDGKTGPQGMKGDTGSQGLPGPRSGGVTYVRWGRTTCPDTEGTEVVYTGRAAGSYYYHKGGGANYQCVTEEPENFDFAPGTACMVLSMKCIETYRHQIFNYMNITFPVSYVMLLHVALF